MASAVLTAITGWLDGRAVAYRHVQHGPTRTSEESAAARREPLEVGAKALVLKVGEEFALFVLSAARKLDSAAVKNHFAVKRVRFASADELRALTGLAPGSVPPFGRPILPFALYVDASIGRLPRVAFNAGSLTDSLIMETRDYLAVAGAQILDFSAE